MTQRVSFSKQAAFAEQRASARPSFFRSKRDNRHWISKPVPVPLRTTTSTINGPAWSSPRTLPLPGPGIKNKQTVCSDLADQQAAQPLLPSLSRYGRVGRQDGRVIRVRLGSARRTRTNKRCPGEITHPTPNSCVRARVDVRASRGHHRKRGMRRLEGVAVASLRYILAIAAVR